MVYFSFTLSVVWIKLSIFAKLIGKYNNANPLVKVTNLCRDLLSPIKCIFNETFDLPELEKSFVHIFY